MKKVNGNINNSSDKNNSIVNEKTDEELLWDYASTLVMIIAGESETLVFHIGDGFAGVAKLEKKDNEEKFSISSQEISEPVNGEYENETRFFVEKNWRENLRVKEIKGDYNFFIVMTDGADPFVINSKRDGLVEMIVTTIYSASMSKEYESLDFILSKVFPIEKVQSLQTDDASLSIIVRP